MPAYESLLASVGVVLSQNHELPYLGVTAELDGDGNGVVQTNPVIGSPAYEASLDMGDVITSINGNPFPTGPFDVFLQQFKVGDTLKIGFERFGKSKSTSVVLKANPDYSIQLTETLGDKPSKEQLKKRKAWLKVE